MMYIRALGGWLQVEVALLLAEGGRSFQSAEWTGCVHSGLAGWYLFAGARCGEANQLRPAGGRAEQTEVSVVRRVLDDSAILPAVQGGLAEACQLGESGARETAILPNPPNPAGREHAEVSADGVVLDPLRLVVKKLELTRGAATNWKFDVQPDGGLAGAVVEAVFVPVGDDGRFVASGAGQVEIGGCSRSGFERHGRHWSFSRVPSSGSCAR